MLYDRHQMQALFQLAIGQPGSSFAIEIARKTGIPEEVIKDASDIVGSEYIQSDKYLQDIVRDKRYWEGKRQTIHQHEKSLEGRIQKYETHIEEIERERQAILRRAKEQADELLREANRQIENTIREIKEAQAEKERTRIAREELREFREQVVNDDHQQGLMSEEDFAKKLRQMEERKARKAQRKEKKDEEQKRASEKLAARAKENLQPENRPLEKGDTVRIKGTNSIGDIRLHQEGAGLDVLPRQPAADGRQSPDGLDSPLHPALATATGDGLLHHQQSLHATRSKGNRRASWRTIII